MQTDNEKASQKRYAQSEGGKRSKHEYYLRNKAKYREDGRRHDAKRIRIQQARLNILKDAPCTDCGGRFSPCAMDFDHVHGIKKYGIIAVNLRRADFEQELSKCELRCANCHRVRHYGGLDRPAIVVP